MNVKALILLFLTVIIGLSACKKNNDSPVATPPVCLLNVINASPDTVNIYLNGTRLNTSNNLYPLGSSGYFTISSGTQSLQFKTAFNKNTNALKDLFATSLKLDSGANTSLFVAGLTSDMTFSTTDVFNQPIDTLNILAYVRFVNASPDAGSFDMYIGSTKFKNQQFKQTSDFAAIAVDSTGLAPLSVYSSGSSTPVVPSGKVPLVVGQYYTFYLKGSKNGTNGSKLGVGTTLNASF